MHGDEHNELLGLITVKDIANANMDLFDTGVLASARTSYRNVLKTLGGEMICGDPDARITTGRIFIGSSPEAMENSIGAGDLVLVSNRYETQMCAVECGAGCIVVCCGAAVPRSILARAQEKGCRIITTPYDSYAAARLISTAAPVRHFMRSAELLKFSVNTPIEDARKVMASVRHRYFPILDEKGRYCGVVSRRNLLNLHRKQIILVDHNEPAQAVDGLDQAEILEIIDHHRIGSLETGGPVYFRNEPVGCTATIIWRMYGEHGVEPPKKIAGLLLSAILSDTLMFRSPTSTPLDEAAARALAAIAGVDMTAYAEQMFEAGADLTGRTAEGRVLLRLQGVQPRRRQVRRRAVELHDGALARGGRGACRAVSARSAGPGGRADGVLHVHRCAEAGHRPDVLRQGRRRHCAGGLPRRGHGRQGVLPGVVSRKKQLIPPLMAALQARAEEE